MALISIVHTCRTGIHRVSQRASDLSIRAQVALMGVLATLAAAVPGLSHAQVGLTDMAQAGINISRAFIDFLITACVLVGLGLLGYGFKLIADKSNDREAVKNSHIIMYMAAGTGLCALWFMLKVLVVSAGGSDGDIGAAATF